MKATRTIPARPVNDGETVAVKITDLVAATLDRSPDLDAGSIRNVGPTRRAWISRGRAFTLSSTVPRPGG